MSLFLTKQVVDCYKLVYGTVNSTGLVYLKEFNKIWDIYDPFHTYFCLLLQILKFIKWIY